MKKVTLTVNDKIFTFKQGDWEVNIAKEKVNYCSTYKDYDNDKHFFCFVDCGKCIDFPDKKTYEAFCKWMKGE